MFCYAVSSFLNLVIPWRVHSLCLGSYNKGILKVIINLWKENGMNFDCHVIISYFFFFSIWTFADTSGCKYHFIFYLFGAHLHLFYKSVPFPPVGHDICKIWFYKQLNYKRRLSLIVRVNVVLNRTAAVDSDWRFDNLCGSHLDSGDDYRTGCRNVSNCQQQQSYSGLHSPGRSNSTYFWNDSWVQTFHN